MQLESIEKEGQTVEEALDMAAEELGCDVEELSREEFVKKWGEDYAQDWDNTKQA